MPATQCLLTLYVAPASLAARMLSSILFRLPSKSIAHWLRLHVAKVASLRLMAPLDLCCSTAAVLVSHAGNRSRMKEVNTTDKV